MVKVNAEIIAVGTEILLGQIVNTNASYLSSKLAQLGIDVFYHTVVGDNEKRLQNAIEIAEQRSDIVIFSGGLGPTKDDMTKQTLARHLGRSLVIDEETQQKITRYFEQGEREMTENNRWQAAVIEGSIILKNKTGLAAGMYFEDKGKKYILLPGPPFELEPMFEDEVMPILASLTENSDVLVSRVLRLFGIGEAQLAETLDDLIETQTNPTIATYAQENEVSIRLTAKAPSHEESNRMIDEMEIQIRNKVGNYIYGIGSKTSLAEVVRDLLVEKDYMLTSAESLTGGLFQSTLVNVPGLSNNFFGGIVSYREEIKQSILGVSKETIEKYTVVSEQCAKEMADGAKKIFGADIGISFTGYAGPKEIDGDDAGLVWIGIAIEGKETTAYRYRFNKDRNGNRRRTVLAGLDLLRRELIELPSKKVNK